MKAIRNNLIETGVIETVQILSKFETDPDLYSDCSMYCPIPDPAFQINVEKTVDSLLSINKEKLLFLTPEIPIIEGLAKRSNPPRIIVSLPSGLDSETINSIRRNTPDTIDVRFIGENDSPSDFTDKNAAIIVFGFSDGDRTLILNYNYRMMEHYKLFYGLRILVSCAANMSSARPLGWAPVNTCDFFNAIV